VLGPVFAVVGFVVAWRRPQNPLGWLMLGAAAYLAVAAAWIAGTVIISAGAIIGHDVHVDSGGNLLSLDDPTGSAAWWGAVQRVFFPVLLVFWLASFVGQALSYRRSLANAGCS
jgi:hypothetical protein